MRCKHGGKCFVDIKNGREAVESPMSCVIAEELGYSRERILAECSYAVPEKEKKNGD